METKPQLNRQLYNITGMEIYFINRSNMSILLNSKSMKKQNVFNLTKKDIHLMFPDDPNIGDVCLITQEISSKHTWFLGKNVWQEFDYDIINNEEFAHLTEFKLSNSHYLFTSSNNNYAKLDDTYKYLFDFCDKHNLQINTILEIFPTDTPRSKDEEIVVDVYLAIENEIPKQLLKQYQPFKIHRRKYNFFTY